MSTIFAGGIVSSFTGKWFLDLLILGMLILFVYDTIKTIKKDKKKAERKREILDGEPTHKGKLISIVNASGGRYRPDISTITLDDTIFFVYDFDRPMKIGAYYKMWLDDSGYYLKKEECEMDGEV